MIDNIETKIEKSNNKESKVVINHYHNYINDVEPYDYYSPVIGGLFSFSMFTFTVFSILGERIKRKMLGIEIIKLKRYNFISIMLPMVILSIYTLFSLFFEILRSPGPLSLLLFFVVIYIIIHSYYIMEIFYNMEDVKRLIIERFIKDVKKDCAGQDEMSINKIIIEKMEYIVENNDKDGNENTFLKKEDRYHIIDELYELINNKLSIEESEKFSLILIEVIDIKDYFKKNRVDSFCLLVIAINNIGRKYQEDDYMEEVVENLRLLIKNNQVNQNLTKRVVQNFWSRILENINITDETLNIIFSGKYSSAEADEFSKIFQALKENIFLKNSISTLNYNEKYKNIVKYLLEDEIFNEAYFNENIKNFVNTIKIMMEGDAE